MSPFLRLEFEAVSTVLEHLCNPYLMLRHENVHEVTLKIFNGSS
jgi:hypothetical protein